MWCETIITIWEQIERKNEISSICGKVFFLGGEKKRKKEIKDVKQPHENKQLLKQRESLLLVAKEWKKKKSFIAKRN